MDKFLRAFPRPGVPASRYNDVSWPKDGMALRTYIATKAMQGFIAQGPFDCTQAELAQDAVNMADELIKALGLST